MTNHRPSYEGRPLPRPAEDVDDQGLAFDLATVATRRRALGLLGLGAAGLGLAACSSNTESASTPAASTGASTTATTGEIPDDRRSVPR